MYANFLKFKLITSELILNLVSQYIKLTPSGIGLGDSVLL